MRIAVNALSVVAGGGVTYLNQLFKHLAEIDKKNEYLIITTKKGEEVLDANYKNFRVISFRFPSFSPILRIFWEQLYLGYVLKKNKACILYSPANIGLIFYPFPTVIMIQTVAPFDKGMIKRQNVYYRLKFNTLRLLTTLSVRKAKKVIFITDTARKELSLYYDLKDEKTALVYHGKSELFKPNLDHSLLEEIKREYSLDAFILYVSNIYRYKNFSELIHAFLLIRDQIKPDLKLVLVGQSFDDKYTESLKAIVKSYGMEGRIIFLGHVPYEELPCFYVLCKLFVYPSTCESFGMTLVEAMACGAPVLASNIAPMKEICQDAAIYFDPSDPQDIAEKIQSTLTNNSLIQKLQQLSLKRAGCFSWEETAKETLRVFENCK